jgi:hypothetical protein
LEQQKVTPYKTKTGIEIGKFYTPPVGKPMSFDEELIQIAFIEDRGYILKEKLKNLAVMVGVCSFALALMFLTKN